MIIMLKCYQINRNNSSEETIGSSLSDHTRCVYLPANMIYTNNRVEDNIKDNIDIIL